MPYANAVQHAARAMFPLIFLCRARIGMTREQQFCDLYLKSCTCNYTCTLYTCFGLQPAGSKCQWHTYSTFLHGKHRDVVSGCLSLRCFYHYTISSVHVLRIVLVHPYRLL